MVAANASGAATKLTSPDPKLATAPAIAVSTYPYMVVNSVMMLGGAAAILQTLMIDAPDVTRSCSLLPACGRVEEIGVLLARLHLRNGDRRVLCR